MCVSPTDFCIWSVVAEVEFELDRIDLVGVDGVGESETDEPYLVSFEITVVKQRLRDVAKHAGIGDGMEQGT